VLVVNKKTTTK